MKKIFKNSLFTFVLGAIIFGSITAYAISSKEISFSPKNENWKVDNLEDAVNDIYGNLNRKNFNNFTILPTNSGNTSNLGEGNRSSFDIPSGVNKAYVLYSVGTTNSNPTLIIAGDIVKEYELVTFNSNTNNYGGNLRSTIYIYEVDLTGEGGTISTSVSGGAGNYRAWTVQVLY